jgi:four helix bundle protein
MSFDTAYFARSIAGIVPKLARHFACSLGVMSDHRQSPFRQRTEKLQERTFEWAARILDLCPRRYPDDPSRIVWRQLIRAAPSASGNLEEADEAFTDQDFLYRMKVVLRETKESRRWLRFIQRCKLARHDQVAALEDEARQLAATFATIYMKRRKTLDAAKRIVRGKRDA